MEALLLIPFVLAAFVLLVATNRSYHRYKNKVCAWNHQAKLAAYAYEVEKDDNAPKHVRDFIGCLANAAFDSNFQKYILDSYKERKSSDNEKPGKLSKHFKKEFGEKYGTTMNHALSDFVYIVLYSDLEQGKSLRYSNYKKMVLRQVKRIQAMLIHDSINKSLHYNDRCFL